MSKNARGRKLRDIWQRTFGKIGKKIHPHRSLEKIYYYYLLTTQIYIKDHLHCAATYFVGIGWSFALASEHQDANAMGVQNITPSSK